LGLFFDIFRVFSCCWAFSTILLIFLAQADQKCQTNNEKNEPNHQPRHQFLTTSATPPATNQQGFTICPDLPIASSPTLPIEWAGGGSSSAGSIKR